MLTAYLWNTHDEITHDKHPDWTAKFKTEVIRSEFYPPNLLRKGPVRMALAMVNHNDLTSVLPPPGLVLMQ